MTTLRGLWREEVSGGLTLAVAAAALRANDDDDAVTCASALADAFARTRFLEDVVTLAWATIAIGPALERLRVAA
jgi:hypothetical protein